MTTLRVPQNSMDSRPTAAADAAQIWRFSREVLPKLNRQVRDGELSHAAFVHSVAPIIAQADTTARSLKRRARRALLLPLGFIACSAERHWQLAGHEPGDVYQLLPPLESALVVAADGDRVPYLTAYTFWIENSLPPLAFVDDPWHRHFHDNVRAQVQLHATVNEILRHLITGQYTIGSTQCMVMLGVATNLMSQARVLFQQMKHEMTPGQFNEFRGWLPKTKVFGVVYPGPNAAWLDAMVSTDILMGTATTQYLNDTVGPALPYYTAAGRRMLISDIELPSHVQDVFAATLGFTDAGTLAVTPVSEVARVIQAGSLTTRVTLEALVELAKSIVGASAAHWGEIQRNLARAVLTDAERAMMGPVQADAGTGGHSHEETWLIHVMRRTFPAIGKIADGLKMLSSATKEQQ